MTRNRDSKFNICILHKINLYQRAGYQPNIILRSNDMEGISIVPGYSHPWDIGTENVVFLPLSGEEEREEMLIAWRRDNDNPALQRFIQKISNE